MTTARGKAARLIVAQVGGEAQHLVSEVEDGKLSHLLWCLSQTMQLGLESSSYGEWAEEVMVPQVCYHVNALLQSAHVSADAVLAQYAHVESIASRVKIVVSSLGGALACKRRGRAGRRPWFPSQKAQYGKQRRGSGVVTVQHSEHAK